MSHVIWSIQARIDLQRVIDFLEEVSPDIALDALEAIENATVRLISYPGLGMAVDGFEPKEIRHIIAGDYEIRYHAEHRRIVILRLWHHREDRPIPTH